MKKIHVILSALAVVLAAGSAFSTVESRSSTVFYSSTLEGANCDERFNSPVCPEGSREQCRIGSLYISKEVDGGDCEMHERP